MDRQINILAKLTIIGFLLSLIWACASPSYLNVRYNLPPASDVLQGKKVVLNLKDTRINKNIFTEKESCLIKEKLTSELLGRYN